MAGRGMNDRPRSTVSRLKSVSAELEQEKQENARLRREVTELRKELIQKENHADVAPLFRREKRSIEDERLHSLQKNAKNATRYARTSYIRFLYDHLTGTMVFNIVKRIYLYIRRFNLVRTISTVAIVVLTALAVSAIYVMILPFTLLLVGLSLVFALLRSGRMNRRMRTLLDGKHIRVLIPPEDLTMKEDSFLIRSAISMAQDPDTAVIVVSPHTFSTRGLGGSKCYLTARQEGTNLFIVRKYYYFILRRRVLDVVDRDLTILY